MSETSPRIPVPRTAPEDTAEPSEHLVVGVDGSPASVGALVWALRYAAENQCPIEVVTAWPVGSAVFVGEVPGHFSEARWNAVQAQAAAIAHAKSLVDTAPAYTSRLENAKALDALVDAGARGQLLVLGSDRDVDQVAEEVPAGHPVPLTTQVQRKAACTVVLVPVQRPGDDEDHEDTPSEDVTEASEPPATVA